MVEADLCLVPRWRKATAAAGPANAVPQLLNDTVGAARASASVRSGMGAVGGPVSTVQKERGTDSKLGAEGPSRMQTSWSRPDIATSGNKSPQSRDALATTAPYPRNRGGPASALASPALQQQKVFDKEFPSMSPVKVPAPSYTPRAFTALSPAHSSASNWTSKLAEAPPPSPQTPAGLPAASGSQHIAPDGQPDDSPSSASSLSRSRTVDSPVAHHGSAAGTLSSMHSMPAPLEDFPALSCSSLHQRMPASTGVTAPSSPAVSNTGEVANGAMPFQASCALASGTPVPRMADALLGTGHAASSAEAASAAKLTAEALRAQLAVKQSKQLVPVLARKGDHHTSDQRSHGLAGGRGSGLNGALGHASSLSRPGLGAALLTGKRPAQLTQPHTTQLSVPAAGMKQLVVKTLPVRKSAAASLPPAVNGSAAGPQAGQDSDICVSADVSPRPDPGPDAGRPQHQGARQLQPEILGHRTPAASSAPLSPELPANQNAAAADLANTAAPVAGLVSATAGASPAAGIEAVVDTSSDGMCSHPHSTLAGTSASCSRDSSQQSSLLPEEPCGSCTGGLLTDCCQPAAASLVASIAPTSTPVCDPAAGVTRASAECTPDAVGAGDNQHASTLPPSPLSAHPSTLTVTLPAFAGLPPAVAFSGWPTSSNPAPLFRPSTWQGSQALPPAHPHGAAPLVSSLPMPLASMPASLSLPLLSPVESLQSSSSPSWTATTPWAPCGSSPHSEGPQGHRHMWPTLPTLQLAGPAAGLRQEPHGHDGHPQQEWLTQQVEDQAGAAGMLFAVPAEEEAFLRSLGWTDGEEGGSEAGLTEEEIQTFTRQQHQQRISAQQQAGLLGVQGSNGTAARAGPHGLQPSAHSQPQPQHPLFKEGGPPLGLHPLRGLHPPQQGQRSAAWHTPASDTAYPTAAAAAAATAGGGHGWGVGLQAELLGASGPPAGDSMAMTPGTALSCTSPWSNASSTPLGLHSLHSLHSQSPSPPPLQVHLGCAALDSAALDGVPDAVRSGAAAGPLMPGPPLLAAEPSSPALAASFLPATWAAADGALGSVHAAPADPDSARLGSVASGNVAAPWPQGAGLLSGAPSLSSGLGSWGVAGSLLPATASQAMAAARW